MSVLNSYTEIQFTITGAWSIQILMTMLSDMPKIKVDPKGKPVTGSEYFCAYPVYFLNDHIYLYVIIIFINKTLVQRYFNRQGTVAISTYGSELYGGGGIGTELFIALRYRLTILGISINGPSLL